MKVAAWVLVLVMALAVSGCAKKTATQQLKDDMKKAGDQLNKELKSL